MQINIVKFIVDVEEVNYRSFCSEYGYPPARCWCISDHQQLSITKAFYGNVNCTTHFMGKIHTYPCGKSVTNIMEPLCNGKKGCVVSVDEATLGTSGCVGEQNLYVEYTCGKSISIYLYRLEYALNVFRWTLATQRSA